VPTLDDTPLGRHAATPAELQERLLAERRGDPFVVWRRDSGGQQLFALHPGLQRVTIGRGPSNDITLSWDTEVSRVHAELERLGGDWTVEDDGLSSNGTYVNGERLAGRHRLRDGDLMRFGSTDVVFRAPAHGTDSTVIGRSIARPTLSEAQRRVLLALCRPYRERGAHVTPATNRQIADELVLSVEAVKTHLRTLFQRFGIENLNQNVKRARLVELALEAGIVSPRDLER
jgi:DNA-binding CsgD family transcriptional regulator